MNIISKACDETRLHFEALLKNIEDFGIDEFIISFDDLDLVKARDNWKPDHLYNEIASSFLLHIVENAKSIKVLSVDFILSILRRCHYQAEYLLDLIDKKGFDFSNNLIFDLRLIDANHDTIDNFFVSPSALILHNHSSIDFYPFQSFLESNDHVVIESISYFSTKQIETTCKSYSNVLTTEEIMCSIENTKKDSDGLIKKTISTYLK